MKQNYLDLYTDYLSVTFGYATATGFSHLLNGEVSHDQLTRALAQKSCGSKELWQQVKSTVRLHNLGRYGVMHYGILG